MTSTWERNGYVPPPRFQQLRAFDNQQQQLQNQFQPQQPQIQFPVGNGNPGGVPPSESPQMSHTRSPSFSFFRSNKQPTDVRPSVHQRTMSSTGSPNGTGSPNQQYSPPQSNKFSTAPAPGVPRQGSIGQPPPQNIPPLQYTIGPQQPQTNFSSQPPPPPPPVEKTPAPNKLQRPPPARQQSGAIGMGHTANASQTSVSSQQAQGQAQGQPAPLHPEIRSVVQLTIAHAHKIYFSGPLVRRIERQPDGQKPHKDEGWTEIWAQLGGTTLSVWDMKEIQEASKQGKEVPPSYVNVTDAFVQVLGSVTVPATPTVPSKRYTNVLTLNTAGSNLLLFSCPSTAALISWAAALRLAAWEKSRLEEIYTAHLIRITLSARDVPTTLVRGKMEGWARVRIAGQTDWKRVWLSVHEGSEAGEQMANAAGAAAAQASAKGKRMSTLFSRNSNIPTSPVPQRPVITMFTSPKPKDRKKPLLTLASVTQAFGVYPERPELISKSTLMKVEGTFGDEDMAAALRMREGWALIMPELENNLGQAAEMLKWVVALHDAFELYGRPDAWTWDPRDPKSLMFGYPVGPQKENLFIDRDVVETMDPRDDRTSVIREALKKLLTEHMKPAVQAVPNTRSPTQPTPADMPPSLPPIGGLSNIGENKALPAASPQFDAQPGATSSGAFSQPQLLPPLNFGGGSPAKTTVPTRGRPLTAITEGGSMSTVHGQSLSMDPQMATGQPNGSVVPATSPLNPQQQSQQAQPPQELRTDPSMITDGPVSHSPQPNSPTSLAYMNGRSSPTSTHLTHMGTQPSTTVTTQNSLSSIGNTTTSPPASNPPTSPKLDETPFFNQANSPPPQPPIPGPQTQKSTPPSSGTSPSHPNFLMNESRTMTQDTVSSQAEVTSLEPISDADQKPISPIANAWNQPTSSLPGPRLVDNTARSSPSEEPNDFLNEAGALYYMQQSDMSAAGSSGPPRHYNQQQRNVQPESEEDETSSFDESPVQRKNTSAAESFQTAPLAGSSKMANTQPPPVRRNTPMAFVDNAIPTPAQANTLNAGGVPVGRLSPTRSVLGRKPSGARAPNSAPRSYNGAETMSSQTVTETDEHMSPPPQPAPPVHPEQDNQHGAYEDENGEALAALQYLDIADSEAEAAPSRSRTQPTASTADIESHQPHVQDQNIPSNGGDGVQYKSSFAPSSKAAERKAKAQAHQAAHHAAVHKPGRANGKRKSKAVGAWESSDEEEEEEEEEDDDDVDSDGELQKSGLQSRSSHQNLTASTASLASGRPQPQIQTMYTGPSENQHDIPPTPSHLRPSRNLPQIPGSRGPGDDVSHAQPIPRRPAMDQYNDGSRRTYYDDGAQIRSQSEFPTPGAARQSMWSQVLDPGRAPGRPDQQPSRDTFVQLDPAETMTKAFTPQGLLSAGLQDKEDRSAKRQEELARESGASLINVPNKPPPPQTGLLGAITAHERERKREGGVGAALTEREREKRLAEERQRRFDDHQRQQLDQMQQGGSMYGNQFGYNPMMNPMMMGMMGMNPMMTGGGISPMMTGAGMTPQMGFPGMMGGFNPHMFAAQQAAQAYQQAMMAFSVAGSQIGGEGGNGGETPSQLNNMGNMNPGMGAMNPAMTGSMAGFDPRMSMMGMPMMGMGMGMGMPGMGGMGMPPQMGGGSQLGGQMPIGMQMSGTSNFDPRASPGGANGSPSNLDGSVLLPPNQPQFSSRTSSPAGRGSPLARGGNETVDRGRPPRPTSPK